MIWRWLKHFFMIHGVTRWQYRRDVKSIDRVARELMHSGKVERPEPWPDPLQRK